MSALILNMALILLASLSLAATDYVDGFKLRKCNLAGLCAEINANEAQKTGGFVSYSSAAMTLKIFDINGRLTREYSSNDGVFYLEQQYVLLRNVKGLNRDIIYNFLSAELMKF